MGDERHAAFNLPDREFEQRLLFAVAEAHRFAGVHRQRERLRAVAQMELEQLAVGIEIDPAVGIERRNRRVD